nr:beta-propeller fold lactonase family protein [Staphylococcus lugdunensis]
AIFKLSDEGAHLELIDIVKSGGVFPRDFNITASDDYIVCAHQEDGGIVTVFERNHDTGKLSLTDSTHVAPEGVCVTFLI